MYTGDFIPKYTGEVKHDKKHDKKLPIMFNLHGGGFPIKTAGKRRNIEIITDPAVPLNICRIADAEKKASLTVTATHMISTNR